MSEPGPRLAAALLISLGVGFSTVGDSLIKFVSGDYPFYQVQLIRCLVALPILLLLARARGSFPRLFPGGWPRLFLRGLVLAASSTLFFLGAAAMPYPEALAIFFTGPLFVAAFAGPINGERVGIGRWAVVALGFAGVVVIVRPGSGIDGPASLLALSSAVLYALGQVLTRRLGADAPASVLAAQQTLAYIALAGAVALVFGSGGLEWREHPALAFATRGAVMPGASDLLLLLAIGLFMGFALLPYNAAYRLADSSFVAPFEYSSLVWAIGVSFILWREIPAPASLAGMAIIVAAGLLMLATERRAPALQPAARPAPARHTP